MLPGGGGIFKSAAVAVLRMERRLMTTGEITRCVSWAGPWLPSRLLSGASHVALPHLVQLPKPQYSLKHRAHGLWPLLQSRSHQGPHQLPGQDARGHHGISPLHRCQAQAGGLRLHPPTGDSPAQQQGRQSGAAGRDGGGGLCMQEGLFGLREWDAEGFVPDNNLAVDVVVGHEPSPVKRIRTGTRVSAPAAGLPLLQLMAGTARHRCSGLAAERGVHVLLQQYLDREACGPAGHCRTVMSRGAAAHWCTVDLVA